MANDFCTKCHAKPCACADIEHARKHGAKRCLACGVKLNLRGGYYGTDLCGVCCCGTAEELDSAGIDW